MSYTNKPFEKLDVMDDFLMNAMTSDPEVGIPFCRKVVSVLLQQEIGKIQVVSQRTLPALLPDRRGIRMDVEIEEYVERDGLKKIASIYDLEPHLEKSIHLPRRNRFYQAKIDSRGMERGEQDFKKLPNLFVITITNFDPFGYDYMMYSVENRCVEVPNMEYGDGLKFIYFYPNGAHGGNEEIRAMLQYLQHSTVDNAIDEATREVHEYVTKVKVLPEVRQGYMRYEEHIYYAKRDGAIEVLVEDILELLGEHGAISEELKEKLVDTRDVALLKRYRKTARKVDSVESFINQMES